MAEGGDSVDSDRKSASSWRNKIPDNSSLYLGSDVVEPLLCREHCQEFKHFCTDHMTEPLLCREHCQEFKHFCTDHMTELCITCKRMGHKNCKTVIGIEAAAETIYSESHGEKITQSVKDLNGRFKDFKAVVENLKSKIPNKRKTAVDKMKQARKKLDDYLDKLQANAVDELDRNLKEYKDTLEEKYDVCTASLASLSTSSSDFERTWSVGDKAEKFIAVNRATKLTKQYCNLLLDMNREMSEINVDFEPNIAFTDILSLGMISVETSKVTDVFTEITPIYTGEMKLKSYDSFDSYDLLPDVRKILLDATNNKIQVYDKRNTFVTESYLPVEEDEACYSVVLNGDNEALVSNESGRVLHVKICDKLSVRLIESEHLIYSMTKYGEDIMCLIFDCRGNWQLCVIVKDMSKIKKTILKDDGTLFSRPAYLGVSADKNTVYVLDIYNGCYGITLDGQVAFHYKNPEADVYGGLVVDNDELFIGVAVGDKIQVERLNYSGERQEVCTVFSNAYPLKLVENELVLCKGDSRIEFYCLIK